MSWFLVIFLSVYLGLHVLYYLAVRGLLPQRPGPRLFLWGWFVFMILAPMLTVLAGAMGQPGLAHALGWVGYFWMGFMLLGLACFLVLDLIRLAWWLLGKMRSGVNQPKSWRRPVAFALAISFLLTAYAGWSATQIRPVRLEIVTNKLPAGMARLKIALTSDLHLGLTGGISRLKRTIKIIEEARPDIWLDAGDLWDRPLLDATRLSAMLRTVKPPLGKYAVFGNHEHYVGLSTSLGLTRAAGFKVLVNQGLTVDKAVNLAGVVSSRSIMPQRDRAALAGLDPKLFTVFMRHRPNINPDTLGHIDLQLSGHAHGGQIYPFHYIVRLVHPWFQGLYKLEKGARLYVTRGTGTWGPPMRLLAPPEVTLIELTRPAK